MSEYINNREMRKNTIKEIIRQLHEGKTVEEVKSLFEASFDGVTASEISEAEGALIAEGLPVEEVQRLCDVHASVFKGSIEEIHQDQTDIPGHPLSVLKRENRELERIMAEEVRPYLNRLDESSGLEGLRHGLRKLLIIDIHYSKKENLFFPYMEKAGITAPPQVMWGVDDEIRQMIKDALAYAESQPEDQEGIRNKTEETLTKAEDMIFKEENILIPMLLENVTQEEWKTIADESGEIGFIIPDVPEFIPSGEPAFDAVSGLQTETVDGRIQLPTGFFLGKELTHMLNTLPFDITFVAKDDTVRFFSQAKDRIFPRTKAIIGRNVSNCHPPASVHVVEQIVEDFKSGKKDQEDFWIKMGDKYVMIQYFAVRDEQGEYLGVVEVTQDIKGIQALTGEKRLVTE
jgi:hypothetical protein